MGDTADDGLNEGEMNETLAEWGGITHLMQHTGINGKTERKKERKKDEVIVETHRQLLHYYPPTLLTSLTSTGRPIE